jgi:aldose 1-epimerase
MEAVPLSGDQIELASGAQRATVATVGATLREYLVGERAVVDGFPADEVCSGGRGQILMPWPNRIADGRYDFSRHGYRLPVDEPELGHAIHGLVRWSEWQVEERAPERVRLRLRLAARPGYPFPLDLSVEYRLSSSGLGVTFGATNVGAGPCPFGVGAHPYFGFAGAPVDAVELSIRANEWIEVDARSIPKQRRAVEGSAVDFRSPRTIGAALLDHAFTGLQRDAEGLAQVVLRHGSDQIRIWQDRSFGFVQVFSGDTLADRSRRRLGLAVEPMSCAANAFNSGDGLLVLGPGESFAGRWGVAT